MKRKVQAQRKFAQGVYIPPSSMERRGSDLIKDTVAEDTKKGKDIIYSNMTPSHLLDVISFENIHEHDARVVVKRLQQKVVTEVKEAKAVVEKKQNTVEKRSPAKSKPSPPVLKKVVEKPSKLVEKPSKFIEKPSKFVEKPSKFVEKPSKFVEKPSKLVDRKTMNLRSQGAVKLKKITKTVLRTIRKPIITKRALQRKKPPITVKQKPVITAFKRRKSPILSGFSTDDDTPLTKLSHPDRKQNGDGNEVVKKEAVKRKKFKQSVVPAKRVFTLRSSASKTSESTAPPRIIKEKPKEKVTPVKNEKEKDKDKDSPMNITSESEDAIEKPKSRQCKSFYSRNEIEKWIVDSAEQTLESPDDSPVKNPEIINVKPKIDIKPKVDIKPRVDVKTKVDLKRKADFKSKADLKSQKDLKTKEDLKSNSSKADLQPKAGLKPKVELKPKTNSNETAKPTTKAKETNKQPTKTQANKTDLKLAANRSEVKVTLNRDDVKPKYQESKVDKNQALHNFKVPEARVRRISEKRPHVTKNSSETTFASKNADLKPTSTAADKKECPLSTYTTQESIKTIDTDKLNERCNICSGCKLFDTKREPKKEVNIKQEQNNDVYAFDETDNVKQPLLTGFRKKQKIPELASDNNPLYLDILPKNSSHTIQLVPVKVPNQEKPIMRAKLVPKTDVNNLKDIKNDQVIKVLEQDSILEQIFNNLGSASKGKVFSMADSDNSDSKLNKNEGMDFRESSPASNLPQSSKQSIDTQSSKLNNEKSTATGSSKTQNQSDGSSKSKQSEFGHKKAQNEGTSKKAQIQRKDVERKGDSLPSSSKKEDEGSYKSEEVQFLEAPTFRPSEAEFEDPIEYIQKISPKASKFGLCKIVPPESFKPDCFIEDTAKFTATNQYPGKMFNRWGPATKELCAIKAHLATQKVLFTRPPLIDSLEVDLPKLYHLVQKMGGLKCVMEKKKWKSVAEEMNYTNNSCVERKLDQVYVKYLLPYDTLTDDERKNILAQVEKQWSKRYKNMLHRAKNPLQKQRRELGLSTSSGSSEEDEEGSGALDEADDCVTLGRHMQLHQARKIGQNIKQMQFPNLGRDPTAEEVEAKYWNLVETGAEHVCVISAALDTGATGYGFSRHRHQPYGKHPWNPKVVAGLPSCALGPLGGGVGVTAPTLHCAVPLAACAWHRDPHALPWLEYLHLGEHKIWYGIPESESGNFLSAIDALCPPFRQHKPIWLASDITMVPPRLLQENGVRLSRVVQSPNEFIIVFPKAFSSSICTGFTISESVYFAPMSWLKTVYKEFQVVRESCEPTMFSLEQLLIAIACETKIDRDILPSLYEALSAITTEETANRRALKEFGITFSESRHPPKKKGVAWNVRELDECDICRTTLYLSKVIGLTEKKSSHCLQHAVKLLQRVSRKRPAITEHTILLYYFKEDFLQSLVLKLKKKLDNK